MNIFWDYIRRVTIKMRRIIGFVALFLVLIGSVSFGMSTYTTMAINQTTTADATALVNVKGINDCMVYIYYDETEVVAGTDTVEATVTFYGSTDDGTTYKYKIGAKPVLTGVYDTDGAIAFTTDTNTAYEIPGVHQNLYIDWNMTTSGTASAISKIQVIGKEW